MTVLGVNGADRDLDKSIRIVTDKPDILVHAESVTKTNIKNVEGFFVPTTSNKEVFIATGNEEDTAILFPHFMRPWLFSGQAQEASYFRYHWSGQRPYPPADLQVPHLSVRELG